MCLVLLSTNFLLFKNAQLDTLSSRKRNEGFLTLTNDEDVVETSSELVTSSISDQDNIEGTKVTNSTSATHSYQYTDHGE